MELSPRSPFLDFFASSAVSRGFSSIVRFTAIEELMVATFAEE